MKKYSNKLIFLLVVCTMIINCDSAKRISPRENKHELILEFYEMMRNERFSDSLDFLKKHREDSYLYIEAKQVYNTVMGDFINNDNLLNIDLHYVAVLHNSLCIFKDKKARRASDIIAAKLGERQNSTMMMLALRGMKKIPPLTRLSKEKLTILNKFKKKGSEMEEQDSLPMGNFNEKEKYIFKYIQAPNTFFNELDESNYMILVLSDIFFYYTLTEASNTCLKMLKDIPQYHQSVLIRMIRNYIFEDEFENALELIKENSDKYPDNKTFSYYKKYINKHRHKRTE
ncbi:hypothetical protein KAU32_02065 [bacterium]|nr:hypothetical protein [bacterium]